MAERLVLHIGSMKSGTSFIQNVLGDNKDRLAEQGVLFPGPRWKFQVNAVQHLIGHGGPEQEPIDPAGPWQSVVDEVNAWPGTAVISMEFLGPRNPEKIAQIRALLPRHRRRGGAHRPRPGPQHPRDVAGVDAERLGRQLVGLPRRGTHRGPRLTGRPQLLAAPGDPDDGPPLVGGVWTAGSPW